MLLLVARSNGKLEFVEWSDLPWEEIYRSSLCLSSKTERASP